MFTLTFVLYKCFYCTVINSYMWNILIHTQTPPALSLQGKNNTRVSATRIHTHPHQYGQKHTHTHKLPVTRGVRGVTRKLYVRLRVWKILDIWSMTGPVSGSFIHWVLFRGFSSMSSNAAYTHTHTHTHTPVRKQTGQKPAAIQKYFCGARAKSTNRHFFLVIIKC